MPVFAGVYAAMLTPFADGGVPRDHLQRYAEFLIRAGVHGLFAFGTTGEWPYLSEEERMRGAEAVVAGARGRVRVVIHTGANSTEAAARLSAHARSAGADAVGIISPSYYPLDEQALFDHFTAVAREVQGFPLFIYNIPSLTRNDVPPQLLLRIARKADNLVGLKYSAEDLVRFREYRRVMGQSFALFIGSDSLALPGLYEGADGVVSGNASAVPELLVGIYALFREGRHEEAARAQAALDEFIGAIDEPAELSSFKAIVSFRGAAVGEVRPPLRPVTAACRSALRARIRSMKRRGLLGESRRHE
jgi:dihydrodipicolinate synthase/N-acetylneuraminate lyase